MILEFAGLLAAQLALLVTLQRTWSPLASVVVINVSEVSPGIGVPLSDHWKVGANPSFIGKALKVTEVPWQIAPGGFAETETLTARFGFTTIVIESDVAGLFNTHIVFEEVRIQLTISPLEGI